MDADTRRLFDAAKIVSTPESRQTAKDRLTKARARMTPEKWADLRARYGVTAAS